MFIKFVFIGFNILSFGMIVGRKIKYVRVLFLALCEGIKHVEEKWLAQREGINCFEEKWLALCEGSKCVKDKWLALSERIKCIKEKWLAQREEIKCVKEKWLALSEGIKCVKEKWLALCNKYEKRDTEEKENKKNRIPFFLTAKSFVLKNNSLLDPESLLNLCFFIIVYGWILYLLADYIKELSSLSWIISKRVVVKACVFLLFAVIFDLIMSFILWMIKTVLNAAIRCYGNRYEDEFFTFFEVIILFGLTMFNFNIYDNLSDYQTLIVSVEIMILCIFVVIDQCLYIERLLKRLIRNSLSYTKEEALSECLLIYISVLLILTIMFFILVQLDKGLQFFALFDKDKIDEITLFTCFRFCALTFIGMGASEVNSESVSLSVVTLVVRLIGLFTSGFIAVEILSHVVSDSRKK